MTKTRQPKNEIAPDNSDYFTIEQMSMALAYKQAKRKEKKGSELNYFLIDCSTTETENLRTFLLYLNHNKFVVPDRTRFQVSYVYGSHWSAIDIFIRNNNVEFYILDAANNWSKMLMLSMYIQRFIPSAIIRHSGYTQHEVFSLQTDLYSCGTFSYDHLVLLSEMKSLPDQLPDLENKFPINGFPDYYSMLVNSIEDLLKKGELCPFLTANLSAAKEAAKIVRLVPIQNFTPEMGPLLRNAQSLSMLRETVDWDKLKGNKNTTLHQYIIPRIKKVKIESESKAESKLVDRNDAVNIKKAKLMTKATKWFTTNNFFSDPEKREKLLDSQCDCTLLSKKDMVAPKQIAHSADLPQQIILISEPGSKKIVKTFKNISLQGQKGFCELYTKFRVDIRKYEGKPVYVINQKWLGGQVPEVISSLAKCLNMTIEKFMTEAQLPEQSFQPKQTHAPNFK